MREAFRRPGRRGRSRGTLVASVALAATIILSPGSRAQEMVLDIDKIFTCEDQDTMAPEPCNQARELFLTHCTTCHNFFQVVLRQYDINGWNGLLNRHRERVRHLSDEEFDLIRHYLAAKFNPDRDPPELPPEIIQNLTDY